jgi:AbiV family abortive infection protein
MHKKTNALLQTYVRGGELIRENAEQLYHEACLLKTHGALARAAALHQLSNEECGKLEMLGSFAMAAVMGRPAKPSDIAKAFRNHEAKNHANAYFSAVSDEERAARDAKDWQSALAIFKRQKKDIHRLFNTGKNASLYVDFSNGAFSAPKDVVDLESAEAMAALNVYFLELTEPYVRLLKRLAANELDIQGDALEFTRRMEELRVKMSDDPMRALSIAFQEMHDRAIAKRRT